MAKLLPETQPREGRPGLSLVTEGSAASGPRTLPSLSLNSGRGCCPLHPIRILRRPKSESSGWAYLMESRSWEHTSAEPERKAGICLFSCTYKVEGWVLQCRTPHIWLGQGTSATEHLVSTIFRKIIWVEWKNESKVRMMRKTKAIWLMVELQAN